MHDLDLFRPVVHAGDELDQAGLVGVGGVAAEGFDAGADGVALAVELHVAALGAVGLDVAAGGAGGLVANEQHVVARVAEHRLEVVDDAAAGAHAAGGDDDGRAAAVGQVADHALVGAVVIHGEPLFKGERFAAGGDALAGLFGPEALQVAVDAGEAAGQGRIQDHRQLVPGQAVGGFLVAAPVDDLFELIEQLLGAANAEGGDQNRALVLQGALDHRFEALAAGVAVFVLAIAVGAFDHQGVAVFGRLGRVQ